MNIFKGGGGSSTQAATHTVPTQIKPTSSGQIQTSKAVIAQEKSQRKQQLGEQKMEMEELKTKKNSYEDPEVRR